MSAVDDCDSWEDDSNCEVVNPSAAALIEALRAFGYTVSTSIADLLDNSVAAGAKRIWIDFNWDGPNTHVTVLDDGYGMAEAVLRSAMKVGSKNPLEQRSPKDLGRFGLGLKTASFAQARSLTVASKIAERDSIAIRRWDLDFVEEVDEWVLRSDVRPEAAHLLDQLKALEHGTLVIWENTDRIVDQRDADDQEAKDSFYAVVDEVREHLEMVFHRFIKEDKLNIRVNTQKCEPWDPFLESHQWTEHLPSETESLTVLGGESRELVIQPFVLPHKSRLTDEEHVRAGGPEGWNHQQGFYLYRRRRLIVSGQWFARDQKQEPHHALARVRVEIPSEVDLDWELDVKKSTARPPIAQRQKFRRIGRNARSRAKAVSAAKGKKAIGEASRHPVIPIWMIASVEGRVEYRINRDHRVVKQFLEGLKAPERRSARAVLKLVEDSVPLQHILHQGYSDEKALDRPEEEMDHEVVELIRTLFCQLVTEGDHSVETAKKVLLTLQPCDVHPEIVDALNQEMCR